MQGLGVQQAAYAVAETPPFDRSYKCFTFWYYMYGSGIGELAVYINTVAKASKILEITGMQQLNISLRWLFIRTNIISLLIRFGTPLKPSKFSLI